jgi:outer membrane immunogenic protein
MKKLLLASVATIATVSAFSAFAADLPSRKAAPVYAPPPPMWTGFYAGLNAGYNFGTNANVFSQNWGTNWVTTGGVAVLPGVAILPGTAPISMDAYASNTQSGFIGGGQVGYNYQYGSNIVLGIEADIQGTGIRGSSRGGGAAASSQATVFAPNSPAVTLNSNAVGQSAIQGGVDWLGTVRGRIGYLWTPTLLVYGTGGFAYGGVYANVVQTAYENVTNLTTPQAGSTTNTWVGGGRQNQLLTGWTAGGGAEWMFMPNWSLKAEALYWDLGRMNVQTATFGVSGNASVSPNNLGWGRSSVSYQGVQAKVGVNYHFNWVAAPVVAAY